MSSFRRGDDWRDGEHSNLHLRLVRHCQKEYLAGRLSEIPTSYGNNIILRNENGEEYVTRPDLIFKQSAPTKPIYLDGPHHRGAVHYRRDKVIDGQLHRQWGFNSIRIPFMNDSKMEMLRVYREILEGLK